VSKYLKKYETFHGKYNPYYAAMIESVDDGIGQIRKKITQMGLDENTLIIFTSDNGGVGLPELGPTPTNLEPFRKWKGHPYEGGIKVPLLWYWKGKIQPGETDYQTTNLDLMPTFAFLLGLKENPAWDGENLVPILFESRAKKRENPLFWHYPHFSNQLGLPSSAVRKGDWKLVFHYEKHVAELYKISSDPSEKENLVKSNPEKAEELFALLQTWLTETRANLPILKSTGKPIELRAKLF
jgi:arylsulfatase A-like enzyme